MKTHSAGALAVGMWHGSSIIGTRTNRAALLHDSHFESRALLYISAEDVTVLVLMASHVKHRSA